MYINPKNNPSSQKKTTKIEMGEENAWIGLSESFGVTQANNLHSWAIHVIAWTGNQCAPVRQSEVNGTTRRTKTGRTAKFSGRGNRALVREVTKKPKITLAVSSYCIWKWMGVITTAITAALNQAGLCGRVAWLKLVVSLELSPISIETTGALHLHRLFICLPL